MYYLSSILYNTSTVVLAVALFAGILIFYLAGVQLGNYQKKNNPDAKADGVGPLEGSLLGLLALLLSFTFSMSASRYDTRRSLLIQEANCIGTTVLRADMYPDSIRAEFRKDLQQYLETRISYYNANSDEVKVSKTLSDAAIISKRIWQRATGLSKKSSATIPHSQMITSLNEMIDVVTTRDAARLARVPDPIIWLLVILTILGSLIIGYSKKEKKNDWIVLSIYSLMTVITIYTIIDLDRPQQGIIKTATAHQKIIELRSLFLE